MAPSRNASNCIATTSNNAGNNNKKQQQQLDGDDGTGTGNGNGTGNHDIDSSGNVRITSVLSTADNNNDNNNNSEDKRILRIAVGTTNPCKIEAVKDTVRKVINKSATKFSYMIEVHVQGFAVESNVPDQPFGDVSLLLDVG
jgi:hypothetical protein